MPPRAIITGGAAGIGAVIAEALWQQGGNVAIVDPDLDALRAWDGRSRVTTLGVDVADRDAVGAAIPGLLSDWRGVDVLVNSAGIAGPVGLAEDCDIDEWRVCVDVGLTSHFLMAQQVIPAMKSQRRGSIISIGSTSGVYGVGLRSSYAAAKAGLVGLVKSLAIELGPYGVTANVINPGSVRGMRIQRVVSDEAALRGVSPKQVEAEYVAGQSIARLVEPREIADLVTFLCSPAARMISGQVIAVDGHTEAFHLPRSDSPAY